MKEPFDKFAPLKIARHDRESFLQTDGPGFAFGVGRFLLVETKVRLTRTGIVAMTGKTLVRQNRQDLASKIDSLGIGQFICLKRDG